MERVVVIVGPTCSGKTKLALALAAKLNSEIISADSRQIYKYLSIGTAKPLQSELLKVHHHFIDELNPDENFNVYQFERRSFEIINLLHSQEKIPIVAGGSGLYIKALVDGIFEAPDADENIRAELLSVKNESGNEALYNILKQCDPVSTESMLPQNWKRVIRAIEVYKLTGKFIWQLQKEFKRENCFQFIQIGLNWNREELYLNINNRVDDMIESGLIEEVKNILSIGYSKSLNALNTVGYKEIIQFLENELDLVTAIDLIKRSTRRFAKRQLTWFRKDKRIIWLDIDSNTSFDKLADEIIKIVSSGEYERQN